MSSLRMSIEYHSGIPVYRQIIHRVTSAVAHGELASGDPLPTIRGLAAELEINPNTVAKAYREMELTGLIASSGRNGTVVAANQKTPGRPSRKERERKLAEIYARALAEARAYQISEQELAELFAGGGRHE